MAKERTFAGWSLFSVQISANSYFGGQSLFSEPFGTSYRLLKVLFTVFTAAAGSPTSLLRKMKLQVSFMTSGSRMWSVYHGNHGSGNPPYECSRQKNLFLRILISRKEPSGIYGWSNDHDPCFSICFRIASFMEMEMAQLNDKFRLWHESDWIECTTCGGFQRPLSGPDLTDTKKKTCLYTNPLLVGRTTPNPQTSEKKTAVVVWTVRAMSRRRNPAVYTGKNPFGKLEMHGLKKNWIYNPPHICSVHGFGWVQ